MTRAAAETRDFTPETELKMGILKSLGWNIKRLAWWDWEVAGSLYEQTALLHALCPPQRSLA